MSKDMAPAAAGSGAKPAPESEYIFGPGAPPAAFEEKIRLTQADKPRTLLRAILAAAVTFLPLLGLSFAAGTHGTLLANESVLGRLLVALPLLILADPLAQLAGKRLVFLLQATGVVPEEEKPWFVRTVEDVRNLRRSWIPLAVMVALAGVAAWSVLFTAPTPVLPGVPAADRAVLDWSRAADGSVTPAGWWYGLVSIPVYTLYRLGWLWRFMLWWVFLFKVARGPLRLSGSHPDRVGGLGFVDGTLPLLAPAVFAIGISAGLNWRQELLAGHMTLQELQPAMVVLGLLLVALAAGPYAFFAQPLKRLRLRSEALYGALALRCTATFETKWLGKDPPGDDELVAAPEISTLADLGSSYDRVVAIKPVPLELKRLVPIVLAALACALPAITTQIPLKQILGALLKILG